MTLSFPDVDLDLTVEAAFGADLTANPCLWAFTDLSSRRHDDPITIFRGARDGTGQAVASSATVILENNDKLLTPLHPLGAQWPNVDRGLPMRAYRGRPSRGAGSGSASNSTSHIAPSVNSATNSALLVCGWLGSAVGNYTLPGGMTAGPAETDSGSSTMRTAYQAISATGATGTKTATHSVSCKHVATSVVVHGGPVVVQEMLSALTTTTDASITTGAGTQAGWWLLAIHGWNFDTVANMPTAPNDSEGGWIPLADSGRIAAGVDGTLHVRAWVRRVNTAGAQTVRFFGRRPQEPEFTASHAHLYVLSGVDAFSARFSQFAARFDPTYTPKVGGGFEVTQQITCGGILRRLERGTSPARSPIAREVLSVPNAPFIAGYWPCEDGASATRFASAIGGDPANPNGAVTPASYDAFPGSQPIPTFGAGGSISGRVASMTDGAFSWRQVMFMPGGGVANGQTLVDIYTTGTGKRWQVVYSTGGGLNLRVLDANGAVIDQTGAFDFSGFILGLRFLLAIDAVQNGANVDVTLFTRRITAANTTDVEADGGGISDSFTSVTIGHPDSWTVGAGGALTNCAAGHMMIGSSQSFAFGMSTALVGHLGETAGRRLARLCAEERIPFHPIGNLDFTQEMGPQRVAKFQELALDCQEADRGILGETRQDFGLFYATLSGLYNRSAGLTVNLATYNVNSVGVDQVFRPVYDDQDLRNDIEVSRVDGSTVRAQDLASQAQGIFDTSVALRLFADDQLANIAAWMLRLGTVKDYRYPVLPIDLGANTGLISAWEALDIGAKTARTNPPSPHPPGTINQILLGYTEIIRPRSWLITTFGAPWTLDVGVYGTSGIVSRYDSANSRLAAGYDADDASFSVETDAGHALWVTGSSGPTFPFDIAILGVRITVTAISGGSSPQTFTVTRSVDGFDKALTSGAQVRLWNPARYGL